MNALTALATGDFRALLDSVLSDDRVEFTLPCPSGGEPHDLIAVRTGLTVLLWGSNAPDMLDIRALRTESEAREGMDTIRREIEQLNGMAQFAAALRGAVTGGDFMVI